MGGAPDPGNAEKRRSFGKRRAASEDQTPSSQDPSQDLSEDPSKPPIKRSQTVSLVLLGGAVAAVIAFAEHDPSQDEEDVLIYPNADACVSAKLRAEADCRAAYATARTAYPASAPRYDTMADCERHHGPSHCVAGAAVAENARDKFVPLMTAYLLGRTAQQGILPQPLFDHAPQNAVAASSGGYGGYCTSSGGRIWTASGGRSSSARVASSVVRGSSFGGFGGTGRSFSSSARSFFGG